MLSEVKLINYKENLYFIPFFAICPHSHCTVSLLSVWFKYSTSVYIPTPGSEQNWTKTPNLGTVGASSSVTRRVLAEIVSVIYYEVRALFILEYKWKG